MSIVTKTGDKGTTGLFGGERVAKHSPRLEAYGTVDELNAALGVALATTDLTAPLREPLTNIQHMLFRVGGDLATPLQKQEKRERIGAADIHAIEQDIIALEVTLPQQRQFILPAGKPAAAHLHFARTVCRRAERRVTALAAVEEINPYVQMYLNRLSDYLFLAAREANFAAGSGDVEVRY